MRTLVKEEDYILETLLQQFQKVNFLNIECSILVNGGPGMGKTTACLSDPMYQLYKEKLGIDLPKILLIQSRSLVRDQQRELNTNPSITIFQQKSSIEELRDANNLYNLIIIDEAHSLFVDSSFATETTAFLAAWLRDDCKIPQIYITASDQEFIRFAEDYFKKKEFFLVFDNLQELHYRYSPETMILSVDHEGVGKVIENKEKIFFKDAKKGIFFVLSAKDAYELCRKYIEKGYNCYFYVSKGNQTMIREMMEEEMAQDQQTARTSYTSIRKTLDILEAYRKKEGKATLEESLQKGIIPNDVDYLFLTDVGQEGISINQENNLDFIFIEDFYPLKVNQKMFRYRGNIPLAYISLSRKKLEKAYGNMVAFIQDALTWGQERLKGFKEGVIKAAGKRSPYATFIYEKDGVYQVAENWVTFVKIQNEAAQELLENIKNPDYVRECFGEYSTNYVAESSKEAGIEDRLEEFFIKWKGIPLSTENQTAFVFESIEAGLRNKDGGKIFGFLTCKKLLEARGFSFSDRKRANKQMVQTFNFLKLKACYYVLEDFHSINANKIGS